MAWLKVSGTATLGTRFMLVRGPWWGGAFLAVVVATNAVTVQLGVVSWLGVTVTAGTWLAGLSLVARDSVHDRLGPAWVAGCILAGAALSALFSPAMAVASAAAFLLSEGADFAVYAPLRRRGRTLAALASNLLGSLIDSAVFLALAGFPMGLLWLQVGVKAATSTAAVLLLRGARAVLR